MNYRPEIINNIVQYSLFGQIGQMSSEGPPPLPPPDTEPPRIETPPDQQYCGLCQLLLWDQCDPIGSMGAHGTSWSQYDAMGCHDPMQFLGAGRWLLTASWQQSLLRPLALAQLEFRKAPDFRSSEFSQKVNQ